MDWLKIAKVFVIIASAAITSLGSERILNHTDQIQNCMEVIKNAVESGQMTVNYTDPQVTQPGSKPDDESKVQ